MMLGRSLTLMGFISAEMRGTKVKLALGLDVAQMDRAEYGLLASD